MRSYRVSWWLDNCRICWQFISCSGVLLSCDVHTTHKLLVIDISCGSDYGQKKNFDGGSTALGSSIYNTHRYRYASMSKNVVTLKLGSEVIQCHWKWFHSVDRVWCCSLVTRFLKRTMIFVLRYTVTLKLGLGVTQGHQKWPIESGAHDFLLMFHRNHRPISYCFRDKQRFPSEIANFSHPSGI